MCVENCAKAQFIKTMHNYNGNGSDVGIYFWSDVVLTYNVSITGHYSMIPVTGANKGVYCDNIKPNVIINNTLSNVSRVIAPISGYVSCSAYETAIGDYYQNNLFLTIVSGYNKNTVKLPIQYDDMRTSVNFSNTVYSSPFSFPVNRVLLPAAPIPTKMDLNPSVFYISHTSNYLFVNSETFSGTADTSGNFGLLCAVPLKNTATGIADVSVDTENLIVTGYFDILGKKLQEEPTTVFTLFSIITERQKKE